MTVYQIIYLSLLTLCLGVGLRVRKSDRSLRVLPILLACSLATEVLVNLFYHVWKLNYNVIYHFYIPLEYALWAYFFTLRAETVRLRRLIQYSIPVYLLVSFLSSWQLQTVQHHPGIIFNLEGVLLIIWCLATLISVTPVGELSLPRLPVFWICLGIMVFHAGIFLFNGLYNHLQVNHESMAGRLHQAIIKNLNYVLYLCFIVAFVCSHQMKKYTSAS